MSSRAPVVYLDTQDFSRFGRVLEGKDRSGAKPIFERLLTMAEGGTASFAYSMGTLSELLQYDPDHEQTSLGKARAVELLCRGHAMASVVRLIAYECARFAEIHGLLGRVKKWEPLSNDDYWFPNLGNALANFRSMFESSRQSSLQKFDHLNRRGRRAAEKAFSDRSFRNVAENAARSLSPEYGISGSALSTALGLYVRNKITGDEASRRLFSSMAKPTAFVRWYFQKYEGEKDLPTWLRSTGESIQSAIEAMANEVARFEMEEVVRFHPHALQVWRPKLASTIAGFAMDDGEEFGLTNDVIHVIQNHPEVHSIPCCGNTVALIGEYVAQCIGLRGTKSSVERSLGGDLVHAMYIPYVDVWRGDRRFSKLIEDVNAQGATLIVPKLSDLPAVIEILH